MSDTRKRIILVEDDEVIRENYQEILIDEGYDVVAFSNRPDAQDYFQTQPADIAILDIVLNDDREGGFQLCAYLRQHRPTLPIIFLTSHSAEHDKISGLRLGADDHLSKEVSIDYLVIRIEALLRRFQNLHVNDPATSVHRSSTHTQRLLMDSDHQQIYWDHIALDLTLTQFWMMQALLSEPGHVKTYQQLMKAAHLYVTDNTVSAHIKTIRNRFKAIDAEFNCIRNERGIGYRWVESTMLDGDDES